MKCTMHFEDTNGEISQPVRYTEEVTGADPDKTSLAYSIFVTLKMVMELINTPYRKDLVSFIASLHKANRDGMLLEAEVTNVDSGPGTRH